MTAKNRLALLTERGVGSSKMLIEPRRLLPAGTSGVVVRVSRDKGSRVRAQSVGTSGVATTSRPLSILAALEPRPAFFFFVFSCHPSSFVEESDEEWPAGELER